MTIFAFTVLGAAVLFFAYTIGTEFVSGGGGGWTFNWRRRIPVVQVPEGWKDLWRRWAPRRSHERLPDVEESSQELHERVGSVTFHFTESR